MMNEKPNGIFVGSTVVENDHAYIMLENGHLIELAENDSVEILNRTEFQRIKLNVLIKTKTLEGSAAFADMKCRVKIIR